VSVALVAAPEPIVRGLSLRDVWCFAVTHLGKRVENRKWNTHHRGPFAIQLSLGCKPDEHDPEWRWMIERALVDADSPAYPGFAHRPVGHVVAVSSIVDVVKKNDPEGVAKIRAHGIDPRWWWPEQYGFLLGPVKIIAPIPCKGAVSLFRLPADVTARLAA